MRRTDRWPLPATHADARPNRIRLNRGVSVAAPFIFINTYAIKEGKLEDFRRFLPVFCKILAPHEPCALAINAYVSADGTGASFVQVHPDAASMEHQHRVAREHAAIPINAHKIGQGRK